MKTWKQLFITSYIAKIKRLKQCRKESSTYKKHNTSCYSHIICESDDWWTTYHNSLIVWKSFAWRCKKTIAWYFIIKKYWRPIWTISWRLYKILDTTNKMESKNEYEYADKRICEYWLQIESCRQCLFETLCRLEKDQQRREPIERS